MGTGKLPTPEQSHEDASTEALLFAGVGLYRFLFDGTIIVMDRGTMRILELEDRFPDPASMQGLNISDLYVQIKPRGYVRDIINQFGHARNLEYPLITLNGTQKWVRHDSYKAVDPTTGQPCVQAIIHDITDDMEARSALQESEARFGFIFKQASIGIVHVDQHGVILEANTALEQILGYTLEQLDGRPFAELGYFDDKFMDEEAFDALLAGERDSYHVTKRFVRADGRAIWCQLTFSLIRDMEDKPNFAIGLLEDVTDREETEQAKSQFLSVLTHELRTPLANIMGWAREAMEAPDTCPEALRVILRNAESQSRMLNNLLELSRLYHNRLILQYGTINLQVIAEQALDTMRNQALAREIDLQQVSSHGQMLVYADAKRLHDIICNLLDNALKFTLPGGRVMVDVYREGRAVRLDVSDTGCGISEEQQKNIFRMFPHPEEENVTSGLRVGLSLVKGIVEKHSGKVKVHSDGEGQGSTFSILLPAA